VTGAGEVWPSPVDAVLDAERDLVVQPDLSVELAEHADRVTERIWGRRIGRWKCCRRGRESARSKSGWTGSVLTASERVGWCTCPDRGLR
jgi:hypothetical protein